MKIFFDLCYRDYYNNEYNYNSIFFFGGGGIVLIN